MNPLPTPREKLAGSMWLARIIAKARALQRDELPPEYAERFGHPGGVDGQFLTFFHLDREAILTAAPGTDAEVTAWFLALPGNSPTRIAEWNHIAENLGRPGFPLAERLPIALTTTYKHLDPTGITSVFEAIEADERL